MKKIGYILAGIALLFIWTAQISPQAGAFYAQTIYPVISLCLSSFSRLFPFSIGDLFIALSIAGVIIYPFYGRIVRKADWKTILRKEAGYLVIVYIWFYLAWGLNYSQPDFYHRTHIPYSPFTIEKFEPFIQEYIGHLNEAYVTVKQKDRETVADEAIRAYRQIADSTGIHCPRQASPTGKTMVFSCLASKVGVSGSMAPFFCEYTINGDVLPVNYPATYMHEMAHFLGISSEAEANFYAYQACIRSDIPAIRFSGYFSVLNYVLGNARRLLPPEKYEEIVTAIRPEIKQLAQEVSEYWASKYSPSIGNIQSWMYDLYLKGNKIETGRKNYSEVIGLLISYREWEKGKQAIAQQKCTK
ncbi:DUF3810 domain-containing protein [Bacteroides sp.]